MGINLYKEPKLENPEMIASWPGIGNIGLIAVDTLRTQTRSEELGEIEPWDFFYPNKVIIRASILTDMAFPTSKFYYKRLANRDLLFFVAEEQPAARETPYAEGERAYEMANLVLDVAQKFGCRRIYTSGAAVAVTHHSLKPRVWGAASRKDMLAEIRVCANTVLMSEAEGRGDQGSITGLNGLLIGAAKRRGFAGVCLMGEIPDYLARIPFPYPRASQAVIEVLSSMLGLNIPPDVLDDMAGQVDTVIANVYEQFPQEIRDRLEQRKRVTRKQDDITEEDEQWFKEHIDDFFHKDDKGA